MSIHEPLPVPGPVHGRRHRARRDALALAVAQQTGHEPALVIVPSGTEQVRNRDNLFPFRFSSDFFYLTGFPEPDALLVMHVQGQGEHRDILFCRDRDPDKEIWDGVRVGPQAATERYHLDAALSNAQCDVEVPTLLKGCRAVVAPWAHSDEFDSTLRRWMGTARSGARAGVIAPSRQIDLGELVAEQRLIKDSDEQGTMRRAAKISAEAHCLAMRATRPGRAEHEIEAVLLAHFRSKGAQSVAYGSIVAGGPHSCILHHRAGPRVMQAHEMLLIDAGCELDGYASDITRSFPVDGRFTPEQRAAYEVVLAAQNAAAEATRPGAAFSAPHDAAIRVLTQGLMDLKLLPRQSLDEAVSSGAFKRFYMHRTGHWLGLDVHDVGDYTRPLQEGMVLTLEPGLYIRPAEDIPEAYWNIGIRIEDDALVTHNGCELITRGVPVEPAEIESLMREAQ